MAGLAPGGGSVAPRLLHALFEFPMMRISMTTGACQVLPVIHSGCRLQFLRFLVALCTRHRSMSAGKHEPGLLVLRQREGRRLVTIQVVTPFASVEIGRARKLAGVPVGMAVRAASKLDCEQRFPALRDMALCTFQLGMPTLQRIRRRRVVLHRERRRLPSVDRMATRAFPAIGPVRELASMGIGLVTVHALRKHQGLFEITVRMALDASDSRMFTQQREFGLRVIELLVHRFRGNAFPAVRGVASLASLHEAPAMRIAMAVGAFPEGDSRVSRQIVRPGRVALLASDLRVQAGQRVPRLRVVKLGGVDRFPIREVVALCAILSKPAFVSILVTGSTRRGDAQERVVQVDLDRRALRSRYVARRVTLAAEQAGMLPLERVACLPVIKTFRVPLDDRKVLAVVLGVAGYALLARSGSQVVGRVQSFVRRQARPDLGVALQALERGLAPKFVACRAVGGAVQRLMRTRQRPRRNLRRCSSACKKYDQNCQKLEATLTLALRFSHVLSCDQVQATPNSTELKMKLSLPNVRLMNSCPGGSAVSICT